MLTRYVTKIYIAQFAQFTNQKKKQLQNKLRVDNELSVHVNTIQPQL